MAANHRKNIIEDPKMERDLCPWKIWCLLNARNDKLFREIDKDLLELIRYVEGELQELFTTNAPAESLAQTPTIKTQVL
ncbi:hypothetical protein Bca4012_010773 [Brassica carinata]